MTDIMTEDQDMMTEEEKDLDHQGIIKDTAVDHPSIVQEEMLAAADQETDKTEEEGKKIS